MKKDWIRAIMSIQVHMLERGGLLWALYGFARKDRQCFQKRKQELRLVTTD